MRDLRLPLVILFAMMIMLGPAPQDVAANTSGDKDISSSQFMIFEMDIFTYRASFRLEDGTEIFLIRSSFRILYYYQHHHPTVTEHYMSAFVGFYYTKTMMGRSIIQGVTVDEVAFYPKWRDSRGSYHDLLLNTSLFTLSESIGDGQLTGGVLLLDNNPISRYIPKFGGTWVFTGLSFILDDGTTVTPSSDTLSIELEKDNNNFFANNATLTDGAGVTYESNQNIINVNMQGTAPLVVLFDMILSYLGVSFGVVMVVLLVLHIKGRIKLSANWLKKLVIPQPRSTEGPSEGV